MNENLLRRVLELEWSMFTRVRSDRPATCQRAPDNFRAIRGALFETWSDVTLASYLVDLETARAQGRNLLSEKYARMEQLVEPALGNPVIDRIVEIEVAWQLQIKDRFPALYERCCRKTDASAGTSFSDYLRGELETYGDGTLTLYRDNVESADHNGRNLALDALQTLVRSSGYRDAGHAEACLTGAGKAGAPEGSLAHPI